MNIYLLCVIFTLVNDNDFDINDTLMIEIFMQFTLVKFEHENKNV